MLPTFRTFRYKVYTNSNLWEMARCRKITLNRCFFLSKHVSINVSKYASIRRRDSKFSRI
uniref:Uncharacterized protein n=1 Tax=Uncultured archaeon GZfos26G2 TaxID=3386331 RepID=Q64CW0_UNCAG|nr:hypothetical protein GZ19C8_28 [uncultured archaeon GZfos19C8]